MPKTIVGEVGLNVALGCGHTVARATSVVDETVGFCAGAAVATVIATPVMVVDSVLGWLF